MKKKQKNNYENYCIISKFSDSKGFRITNVLLKDLVSKSKKVHKKPLLKLIIKKDKNSVFEIECKIKEKKISLE